MTDQNFLHPNKFNFQTFETSLTNAYALSQARMSTSMGDVWLATQIPEPGALFSTLWYEMTADRAPPRIWKQQVNTWWWSHFFHGQSGRRPTKNMHTAIQRSCNGEGRNGGPGLV